MSSPSTAAATAIITTPFDTPVGPAHVASRDGVVVACRIGDGWDDSLAGLERRLGPITETIDDTAAADAVRRYFSGTLDAVDDLEVDPPGTEFQRRVWAALRTIPVGTTWSYRDLATAVGDPGATRAVGTANGANPIWLIVPCHRVVRSDGDLGGYAGGLDRKAWLLAHEGARLA